MSNTHEFPTSNLILIPTKIEQERLEESLSATGRAGSVASQICLCGFGPITAGIETTRLLAERRMANVPVERVILVGIAGSYDLDEAPTGDAFSFQRVGCYGIGAGEGANFQAPSEMGWTQDVSGQKSDGIDRIDGIQLEPVPGGHREMLLTVTSAASNSEEVKRRRQRFPLALAEDMESFSVAMASARYGLPLTVIRGISNAAGDRKHANWKIESAMDSVARILLQTLKDSG